MEIAMIFELLSKDEVIEKISYMYQFSDRNTNENIQNAILNNYDKNIIILYTLFIDATSK